MSAHQVDYSQPWKIGDWSVVKIRPVTADMGFPVRMWRITHPKGRRPIEGTLEQYATRQGAENAAKRNGWRVTQ